MSDNDFREVIDGEENKRAGSLDNNLHTTEAESAEVVNSTVMQESEVRRRMSILRSVTSVTDRSNK